MATARAKGNEANDAKAAHEAARVKAQNGGDNDSLPDGFTSVRAELCKSWFVYKPGHVLHGEVMGRFVSRGQFGGYYYQICVAEPTPVRQRSGDDWEYLTVERGELVNVEEKAVMSDLEDLCTSGERHAIYLRVKGKGKTAANLPFWDMVLGKRQMHEKEPSFATATAAAKES